MQTTLSHSLFHSRIGRRILGLFVLCALVPTSLLGWMSYRQVTHELIAHSATRLKQESKSQGMVLYNHLLTFTADMSRIAAELPQDNTVTEEVAITDSVNELAHRFREVRLTPATGPHRRELTQAQTAHLQEGKSLLEVSSAAGQLPQLTLTRLVNPAHWEAGLLSVHLDDTALWSTQVKETLPGDTDLVVEDGDRHVLYSSHEPAAMVNIVQSRITESIACDAVGMMLLNLEDTGPTELSVRYIQHHQNQSDETKTYPCQLSEEHLAAMATHPHHLVAMGTAVPSCNSVTGWRLRRM